MPKHQYILMQKHLNNYRTFKMHIKVMNVLDDATDSVVDEYETVKKKRNM